MWKSTKFYMLKYIIKNHLNQTYVYTVRFVLYYFMFHYFFYRKNNVLRILFPLVDVRRLKNNCLVNLTTTIFVSKKNNILVILHHQVNVKYALEINLFKKISTFIKANHNNLKLLQ